MDIKLFLINHNPIIENVFKKWLKKEIENNYPEIDTRDNLSFDEFIHEYRHKQKPVILRNITNNWPALKKWDFEYFKDKCGNTSITSNIYTMAENMTLSHFIDLATNNVKQHSHPMYLQEWHFQADCPFLLDDIELIPHISKNDWHYHLFKYHFATLWIGQKGCVTTLHQDIGHLNVFQTSIIGTKKWYLFGPNADIKLKLNGTPDFDEFLNNPLSNILHCTLRPGEILFLPPDWWHRVETLENNISITINPVDKKYIAEFVNLRMKYALAIALNKEEFIKHNPNFYKICLARLTSHAKCMGLDENDILGLKTWDYLTPSKVNL